MTRPYIAVGDCTSLAINSLGKAGVHIEDGDVEDMAESIKNAIDAWFGDMKHLTPNYRPVWNGKVQA